MSKRHQHQPQHSARTDGGTTWEVCDCGASRCYGLRENPPAWHTCERCTHPYGRDAHA